MMFDVKAKIDELQKVVATEINESKLIETGCSLLNELRKVWHTQKKDFSDDDVSKLQLIRNNLEAVRSFVELKDEIQYVSTKEDVHDLIHELLTLAEQLEAFAISKRMRKEIRELYEKVNRLPTSEERKKSSEFNRAILKLNEQAPKCKKCGTKMVVREGNGKFFWGCPCFPDCWGRCLLNKKELEQIPD
jgi:dGTP triphosphohydrolase